MANQRAVHRYEIPVDDRWHTLDLWGDPLYVAARDPGVVEIWAVSYAPHKPPGPARTFRVFGTGHPVPPAADRYVGTALAAGGGLVWHLWEHTPAAPEALDG